MIRISIEVGKLSGDDVAVRTELSTPMQEINRMADAGDLESAAARYLDAAIQGAVAHMAGPRRPVVLTIAATELPSGAFDLRMRCSHSTGAVAAAVESGDMAARMVQAIADTVNTLWASIGCVKVESESSPGAPLQ